MPWFDFVLVKCSHCRSDVVNTYSTHLQKIKMIGATAALPNTLTVLRLLPVFFHSWPLCKVVRSLIPLWTEGFQALGFLETFLTWRQASSTCFHKPLWATGVSLGLFCLLSVVVNSQSFLCTAGFFLTRLVNVFNWNSWLIDHFRDAFPALSSPTCSSTPSAPHPAPVFLLSGQSCLIPQSGREEKQAPGTLVLFSWCSDLTVECFLS